MIIPKEAEQEVLNIAQDRRLNELKPDRVKNSLLLAQETAALVTDCGV